jgi:hypothetical protein
MANAKINLIRFKCITFSSAAKLRRKKNSAAENKQER